MKNYKVKFRSVPNVCYCVHVETADEEKPIHLRIKVLTYLNSYNKKLLTTSNKIQLTFEDCRLICKV